MGITDGWVLHVSALFFLVVSSTFDVSTSFASKVLLTIASLVGLDGVRATRQQPPTGEKDLG